VFLVPDSLKFFVVIAKRLHLVEGRRVVVSVTIFHSDPKLEISALPKVEGNKGILRVVIRMVNREPVLIEWRSLSFLNLVKNLLAIAIEEHLTIIVWVGGVRYHINVRNKTQPALLSTSLGSRRRIFI
jgi:hypothetical protein